MNEITFLWYCKIKQVVLPYGQVLFNDTIYHNINYGRLSATEEEVYYQLPLFYIFLSFLFTLLTDEFLQANFLVLNVVAFFF